jgi:hypothetical protein
MRLSIGNIVAVITAVGIVAQIFAYTAASGYYSVFDVTPEQIGITPLNALERLFFTSLCVALILAFAAITIGYFAEKLRRPQVKRGKLAFGSRNSKARMGQSKTRVIGLRPAGSVGQEPNLALSRGEDGIRRRLVIVAILPAVVLLTFAWTVGQTAGLEKKLQSDSTFVNPVGSDLEPTAVFYRWTKPEEVPLAFFLGEKADPRYGLLLGINNGLIFIFDWDAYATIIAPASQIQMRTG